MTVLTAYVKDETSSKLITAARGLVYVSILSLMFYVHLMNTFYWAAAVLILFSGFWRSEWQALFKDRFLRATLVLVFVFMLGTFYSHTSWHLALRGLDKYAKVIAVLFLIPIFSTKARQNLAISALILTVMCSVIIAYLHHFNLLIYAIPTKHWFGVQDIDASFIVAFTCYLLANLALDKKDHRALYVLGLIICSIDLLFLNQERTGYLIFLALAGLILCQRMNWKGLLFGMLLIPILFIGLYEGSEKFHDRVDNAISDIQHFQKGEMRTSIGLRLAFATYSFKIIKEHPWIGVGTGSFQEVYARTNGPRLDDKMYPAHAHNEYISFLFQWGIVGLFLFCYWFYEQARVMIKLPRESKFLAQGLVISFLLLSLCNASLYVNPAGGFFITFLAVFFGPYYADVVFKRRTCE